MDQFGYMRIKTPFSDAFRFKQLNFNHSDGRKKNSSMVVDPANSCSVWKKEGKEICSFTPPIYTSVHRQFDDLREMDKGI